MRPIDKTTARYHTDLSDERYHVGGRSKRLAKRCAKRKSGKAYRRALTRLFSAVAALFLCVPLAQAATVQLRDGGTVEGEVLQVEDDSVVIALPRERVTAIDGKPLPVALGAGISVPGFTVRDIQGRAWTVGAGDKITLLHFWVHWCPHCRADARELQVLHDRYRDNPRVQILSVNLDRERAEAERFVQEHHATYPVVSAAEQAKAPGGVDLAQRYQIAAFPITYLIDGQGVIRQKIVGSFAETGRDVGAMIERLL